MENLDLEIMRVKIIDNEVFDWSRIFRIHTDDVDRAWKLFEFFKESVDYPDLDLFLRVLDEEMIFWEEENPPDYVWEL